MPTAAPISRWTWVRTAPVDVVRLPRRQWNAHTADHTTRCAIQKSWNPESAMIHERVPTDDTTIPPIDANSAAATYRDQPAAASSLGSVVKRRRIQRARPVRLAPPTRTKVSQRAMVSVPPDDPGPTSPTTRARTPATPNPVMTVSPRRNPYSTRRRTIVPTSIWPLRLR